MLATRQDKWMLAKYVHSASQLVIAYRVFFLVDNFLFGWLSLGASSSIWNNIQRDNLALVVFLVHAKSTIMVYKYTRKCQTNWNEIEVQAHLTAYRYDTTKTDEQTP